MSLHTTSHAWLRENAASVLDAVVDAIITIDEMGVIQSYNKATENLFGIDDAELVGQPVEQLMPEPYRSAHQSFIDRYLQDGNPRIIGIGRELVAQRGDGSQFPIYLAVSEIESDQGRFFAGIIRDLSEQKAAEAALLEQKDRVAQVGRLSTMGEMTASIAHEINQPLTAISMYAQACIRLLAKDNTDLNKIHEAMEKLNAQSLRAGAVIERIQRFVQNVGGQREFVDINDLLTQIRVLAAGDARMHGIALTFELSDALPPVFCDAVQIQQVTLNLIRNAIDAMYDVACQNGTEIVVTSAIVDDAVEISVCDCGSGVSDENAGLLFTAFHTTKPNGMGMGLSICRSIIEDHGGALSFQNNAGHGTTFYFRLPLGAQDE